METLVRQGLEQGGLGIGTGIAYAPGATREDIYRLFKAAAESKTTFFVHVRYAGRIESGSSVKAAHEMIADAAATGASVHIIHIGSSGLRQVPLVLDMIQGARQTGLDVSIVAGTFVVKDGALIDSARPGRPVRRRRS